MSVSSHFIYFPSNRSSFRIKAFKVNGNFTGKLLLDRISNRRESNQEPDAVSSDSAACCKPAESAKKVKSHSEPRRNLLGDDLNKCGLTADSVKKLAMNRTGNCEYQHPRIFQSKRLDHRLRAFNSSMKNINAEDIRLMPQSTFDSFSSNQSIDVPQAKAVFKNS